MECVDSDTYELEGLLWTIRVAGEFGAAAKTE